MKCPNCGVDDDKVLDTRVLNEGKEIKRRRKCNRCGYKFTTYERYEATPILIVKNDGRREPYKREKIKEGIALACKKRPVSYEQIEKVIDQIEEEIFSLNKQEVESKYIGKLVMEYLSKLDEVAYVRFASVYKKFKDTNEFMEELKNFLSTKNNSE